MNENVDVDVEGPVPRADLSAGAASSVTSVTSVTSITPQTAVAPAPSSTGTPGVSRTRLLCDAVLALQPGAQVLIVDTRTTLLSQADRNGRRVIRVHQMFLDTDDEQRQAVAIFLATGNKRAGRVVDDFVRDRTHLLEWTARPLRDDAHVGKVHDLARLYAEINGHYFDGAIEAEICWGQAGTPTGRSRRSITFGSYDHRIRRITIHPVLDAPHVPAMVVARVVHHEMLHAKHGEGRSPSGRRVVHSRAFRLEEATFAQAALADTWIEAHLDALLRWRPRSER